ncbi:MAG: phosphoribosylaminoimidazolesuccinocarboxamide synthase [Schleiferiaceae bacterium]|nr:phosphoribosylaminoimidazolesuccinocarboxamide synthase [Schleiferiaceae bacterium]
MLQLGQLDFYRGKVRDVYTLPNGLLAVVASDRLSAFDVVLDQPIPYKGQVLNQMAGHFLEATADIVPNWRLGSPHPLVTVGRKATPFKVEMVIRGYLSGHAWRTYAAGGRTLCGVALPEGLRESDALPEPIITPTTKAALGSHDEDISREAILEHGIVAEQDYLQLEAYTRALFARGQAMARESGLLLVDTKYEFGTMPDGTVVLIDEIHTPDSSRYFEADGYEARQAAGAPQQQLSKEFVRQWLIANGFQGQEGQAPPVLPESFIDEITSRYIALYERMTGTKFEKAALNVEEHQLESAVRSFCVLLLDI